MKKAELLATQTSAGTADNEKSISVNETAYEQVEGTPFTIIKQEEGWIVVMGKYRMTEKPIKNKKLAIEDARKITWDRITAVLVVVIESINEEKK